MTGSQLSLDDVREYELSRQKREATAGTEAMGIVDALGEGVDKLKVVQPVFRSVVTGITDLNDVVDTMDSTLTTLWQEVNFAHNIAFTQEDAEGVQAAWAEVRASVKAINETSSSVPKLDQAIN